MSVPESAPFKLAPLDLVLRRFRAASAADNPFAGQPGRAPLAATFPALAHAVADFVDAGRKSVGYGPTRTALLGLVDALPEPAAMGLPDGWDAIPTAPEPEREGDAS